MVPVEVDGDDSRGLLPDIVDDRKTMIFNPFHSHVDDLGGNAMALKEVGQSEEPHGQEVDPDEMMDRPVVIGQLGDMKKDTVKCSHRANCKMPESNISTSHTKKLHCVWRTDHSEFMNLGILGFRNSKFLNS
jgi:hypothetical protein